MGDDEFSGSNKERDVIIELERMAGIAIKDLGGPTKAPGLFTGYLTENGKIRHLSIHKSALETLPENIGSLEFLETLYLEQNKIKEFPDTFGNLVNLKILNLSHNNLKILPRIISRLKNLRELNVASNILTVIPPFIRNLENIEKLIFVENKISSIPSEIRLLKNLKQLFLFDNPLVDNKESLAEIIKTIEDGGCKVILQPRHQVQEVLSLPVGTEPKFIIGSRVTASKEKHDEPFLKDKKRMEP
ncbi:MAG: leucine-rich repeat domain-containing protein [Promethearchaeota archaeon]